MKSGHLDKAVQILDFLLEEAVTSPNEISWLAIHRDSIDNILTFSNINRDLYEGVAGISYVSAYLYYYTGENRYRDCALKIVDQLKREFLERERIGYFQTMKNRFAIAPQVSGYSYPACCLFLLMHLRHAVGADCWDAGFARHLIAWLTGELTPDTPSDMLLGAVGLLSMLIDIARFDGVAPDFMQDAIAKVAQHITATAISQPGQLSWSYFEPMDKLTPYKVLGGYAHGTAGIATVLAKMYRHSGDAAWAEKALLAYQHDQSFYDAGAQGWIDMRERNGQPDGGGWCHGSTGIALSRLQLLDLLAPVDSSGQYGQQWRAELAIALKNSLKKQGGNDGICHGDYGILEVARATARTLGDAEAETRINAAADAKLQVPLAAFRSGQTQTNQQDIGLFNGLAGAAYTHLRFYDWEAMPSVLALETPNHPYSLLHA